MPRMRENRRQAHRQMGADRMISSLSQWRSMKVASFRPIPCRYCTGMPEVNCSFHRGPTYRIKCGGCNEDIAMTFLEVGDAVDAWNAKNGGVLRCTDTRVGPAR